MSPVIFIENSDGSSLLAFDEETSIKMSAGNSLSLLNSFIKLNKKKYLFGFLGYDVKNEIENLNSNNLDFIGFPDVFFFCPKYVVAIDEGSMTYLQGEKSEKSENFVQLFLNKRNQTYESSVPLSSRITKEEYLAKVNSLKSHLQRGDIYEVTFCQEFFSELAKIDPIATYHQLSKKMKAPFSCYVEVDGRYLLSGSPERFLKKEGNKLTSQPIKGTARRGKSESEDEKAKANLLASEKERSENVMIVDLVRNDLSRIAKKNSVKVDELCGLYSFPTVHQLISTVSAISRDAIDFEAIMRALFPMGSMTGAPKISAMQLIESHENFKRGLFSGSVGYIKPNGDFDFNVVIRSILYNEKTSYLSCPVGAAITIKSDPEAEYEECLLKAEAMMQILDGSNESK